MEPSCPVTDRLAKSLSDLKKDLQKTHAKKSHILEAIPSAQSRQFPIKRQHLDKLREFADNNPIYYNSYKRILGGVECTVYEGDANRYWLGSIGHPASKAPFSPTWLMSAYVISRIARDAGHEELVDIGSGDGRIAFCAKLLGMNSFSIEIDRALADLQITLSDVLCFESYCSDAASFDYARLSLRCPVFVVGGIAQMGGTALARGVMERVEPCKIPGRRGWVLAGTHLPKYPPDPKNEAGWGTFIEEYGLRTLRTVQLPTAWTLAELEDTPYVFAESANSNPN